MRIATTRRRGPSALRAIPLACGILAAVGGMMTNPARAQFTIDEAESEGAPTGAEELVEEVDEGDWERPRILVVRAPRTPDRLLRSLGELIEPVGEVLSWREFERDARRRGLAPTADSTLETLLPDRDITLVILVSRRVVRRQPVIRLSYREGHFGTPLLTEVHPISGDTIPEQIAERIQAEAILAVTALTRPTTPQEMARDNPRGPAPEAGAAVRFIVSAGAGVGTRGFRGPLSAGAVRLETSLFPSALMSIRTRYEPTARGQLTFYGELAYMTSIGLETIDTRIDGSTRETSSRSQRLDLAVGLGWRFGNRETATSLRLWLGWGSRIFDTEAPVSLPDYSLGGPTLSVRVTIPLGSLKYRLTLGPLAEWVFPIGDGLQTASPDPGWAFGGTASLRIDVTTAWAVEGLYRESHASLGARLGDIVDVERYGTLNLIYEP